MTENELLAPLIDGCLRMQEASQIALYRRFYSYGMSICLRYANNRESALEMLNDGFLKVFQKIEQYDRNQPFKPWLRRILINASIDHYRKYQQEQTNNYSFYDETSSTYNEALSRLEYDDLLKVLHHLPSAYRMAFNLYVVEEMSHAEIAAQLKISVGTSKSNLSKARQKIKELLKSSHDIHLKI